MTNLDTQLEKYRRTIATDAYPMSIGEIANLYRDGELNIHPEFQRLFRWTDIQQTRLIESILLGIPLPSIFVAATDEGWDVVDGVQRLSTIFNFMGILGGPEGRILPPFKCCEPPILKALDGISFQDDTGAYSLTSSQRIDFKRSRLDIKIIKRHSDNRAKFDLFQRLNSYGTPASEQELRNSLLLSLSTSHYDRLKEMANYQNFKNVLNIPEKLEREQYHMEMALRFTQLRRMSGDEMRSIGYVREFLDRSVLEFSELSERQLKLEYDVLRRTFDLLNSAGESDILRKWNPARDRSEGAFSATAFEVIALGVGYHDAPSRISTEAVKQKRVELWSNPDFGPGFSTGLPADQRMRKTLPYGRELFA